MAFIQSPVRGGSEAALHNPYTLLDNCVDAFLRSTSKHVLSILHLDPGRGEVTLLPNSGDPELCWLPNAQSSISFNKTEPGEIAVFAIFQEYAHLLAPRIVVEFDVSGVEFCDQDQRHTGYLYSHVETGQF